MLAACDPGQRQIAHELLLPVDHRKAPDLFVAQVGDTRDHDKGFRDPASDDSSGEPGIGTRFAYPGIGTYLVNAVTSRDVVEVQAAAIVLAALYIVINVLADLIVVFLVPRLRTGTS